MGGGGLYNGVRMGLQRVFNEDIAIVTVETEGTASLQASIDNEQLVMIPPSNSIATSLGCRLISAKTLQLHRTTNSVNHVVSDLDCIQTIDAFLNMHRCLVEPACAAALSIAYRPEKLSNIISNYFNSDDIKNIII